MSGKTNDSVTIEWYVPHDCRYDHGPNRPHHLAIDSFRVFVKPAKPTNSEWKLVSQLDHYINHLTVGRLKRGEYYYFGVAVVNQSGQGEIISIKEAVCPEALTSMFCYQFYLYFLVN